RVRRQREEEDDDVRGAALDLAARGGDRRGQTWQHDRQSVLRVQRVLGDRQLQQVLLVHRQGPEARTGRYQEGRALGQLYRRGPQPEAGGAERGGRGR